MYSRNANLKQVILDELFAKHGDAELNAQFHQTASMGALQRETSVSYCGVDWLQILECVSHKD